MKVALVAFSVKGAMGQYASGLAGALARRVPTALFVPRHFEAPRPGSAVNFEGVEVRRFITGRTKARALTRLLNPLAGMSLAAAVAESGADVVHILSGEGYPWAAILAARLARAGIPLVVTLHDPVPHPGDVIGALTQWAAYRTTLRRADVIHVHARRFAAPVAAATGRAEDGVAVIPHPSFADFFLPYRREGIAREERTILFFGRLKYYKGLDTLVSAMLLLKARRAGYRAVIAGPGRLPPSLRRVCAEHADTFEVHARYLPEEEVAVLFQRAALCVLPYRDATQSAVPSIAAAFGVPVLATSVGAFTEDVPFYGGTLVPPGDPEALARSIPEAARRRPANAGVRSFAETAERFAALYEALAARRRA